MSVFALRALAPLTLVIATSITSVSRAQQLYWSESLPVSRIGRLNLDGTGSVTVQQQGRVSGMDADPAAGKVYWINSDNRSIQRANLDCSDTSNVLDYLSPGNNLNLAVDTVNDLVFWTHSDRNEIGIARLSDGYGAGSYVPAVGGSPDDIAVDPIHHMVYWTNQNGELDRAGYFFGLQQVLFSGAIGGLPPYSAGLALDLEAGKIYYAATNAGQILRFNLDGTGRETLLTLGPGEYPFGLELFGGRMYWAERELGTLRSARLDGSDVRTILSGLGNPQAVRIVPEPAARGTVWIFAVAFALSSDTLRRRERNRRAPAPAWLGAIRTESGGTLFSRSRSCRNRRA